MSKGLINSLDHSTELYLSLKTISRNLDYLDLLDDFEDDLKELKKFFLIQSLISNKSSIIMTVAGPQGVGKSSFANSILKLNDSEALPTGDWRAERMPVLIFPSKFNEKKKGVSIYKIPKESRENNALFFEYEELSYDKGRERVVNPNNDDLIAFWYISDNNILYNAYPFIVLPGIELCAPWNTDIKTLVNLSDVIFYVTDSGREAQESANSLQKWIKETEPIVNPITIISFSNTLNNEQKRNLKSVLKERGFYNHYFFDNKTEISDDFYDLIENSLKRRNIENRRKMFVRNIKKTKRTIKKIRKFIEDKEIDEIDNKNYLVRNKLNDIDEKFGKIYKIITKQLQDEVERRINNTLNNNKDINDIIMQTGITKGTKNKIRNLFVGIPFKDKAEFDSRVKKEFERALKGLDSTMKSYIEKYLENTIDKEKIDDIPIYFSFITPMIVNKEYLKDYSKELRNFLKNSSYDSESMVSFLKKHTDLTETAVNKISDSFKKIKDNIGKLDETKASLSAGAVTAGAAEAALEASGAGVSGATLSTIMGIVGGAIAVIGTIALYTNMLKHSNNIEYELANEVEEFKETIKDKIISQFREKLLFYREIMLYNIEENLENSLGGKKINKVIALEIALENINKNIIGILDEMDA